MSTGEAVPARPGLRERKKQQTRDTIARVALRLFAERGYGETTLAEIAEAADVSPRTIFSYFQSKEDILFCEDPAYSALLADRLQQRPPGTTTVDALRDFLSTVKPPDEEMKLRKQIITSTPDLYLKARARFASIEQLLVDSIAKDLDAGPDDIRPPLIAASITAAFTTLRDRLEAQSGGELSHEQVMGILEEVLEFLRGGLAALQRG